jgi:hypothetical protein
MHKEAVLALELLAAPRPHRLRPAARSARLPSLLGRLGDFARHKLLGAIGKLRYALEVATNQEAPAALGAAPS